MSGTISVMCVDDSPDIAELYRSIIDAEDDMRCVGTLPDASELPAEVNRQRPAVVLMDLSMPTGPDPLGVMRELAEAHPGTKFLLFSGYDDPGTVDAAFEAGAWGLVPKHSEPRAVVQAIRAVAQGQTAFPGGGV